MSGGAFLSSIPSRTRQSISSCLIAQYLREESRQSQFQSTTSSSCPPYDCYSPHHRTDNLSYSTATYTHLTNQTHHLKAPSRLPRHNVFQLLLIRLLVRTGQVQVLRLALVLSALYYLNVLVNQLFKPLRPPRPLHPQQPLRQQARQRRHSQWRWAVYRTQ